MNNATRNYPLKTGRNSGRSLIVLAAAAAAVLAAGTLATSAQTPSRPQGQQVAQATQVQGELRSTTQEPATEQRRQVRVIPLFNTPGNQTGK